MDVVEEAFRRIDECGDPGIFIHLMDKEDLLRQARALGPFDPDAKPLWGIPFAIKDNIDAADTPTTAACPAYAYQADADAYVVELLRNAGALLIGKTNLDQFATGLVGVRTPYPVPKNALDPEIVPGGSSGGSGVVVAHGIVSFSLGTDTAGSGRVPAALNRIVGLKPTLGALSNRGLVPACRTLDAISIFSLSVDDAYQVLQVAASYDDQDAYARPVATPGLSPLPATFKVGVPDEKTRKFFGDTIQAVSFSAALSELEQLGGDIVEIDFTPFYQVADMLYEGAWSAERLAVIEDLLATDPDAIHPTTRKIIEPAKDLTAADAFRGIYRLQELKHQLAPLLKQLDLLCVPSIPTFYTCKDLEADPIGPNSRFGTYTNFVNLLDLCAIAVPVRDRMDGRPGSVTLIAEAGQDAKIAALASELQAIENPLLGATGWSLPVKAVKASEPAPDEMILAAVGAHMSGLPLNGELTRLGARFLKATHTAESYRLYALAGGPPKRPGLVYDADGAAIALELWAMPSARFGEFLKGVPRPLGIGTVVLQNGDEVNGFICEGAGTLGAEDVTRHGGWRAYLKSLEMPQQESKKELTNETA